MRIYFNGCSWTWGGELDSNGISRDNKFSTVICRKMNAIEVNKSKSGSSNFYIMRTSLDENPKDYDLAIIQLTLRNRTEYFDKKLNRWANVHQSLLRKGSPHFNKPHKDNIDLWLEYYKNIYTTEYGLSYENVACKAIRGHFHSIPVIITTNNADGPEHDLRLEVSKYPRMPKRHPSVEGHKLIAEDIIKLI
tara:strand:- start:261 stop:836 length:576 start_codon:yes stop_codon:yes gene_type:complete